jgi:asparagine synthase (glutamine-hydrolysing)
MCGIVAIIAYGRDNRVSREELSRIRERMHSRGPDGSGSWFSQDDRVGLGHRRLAIIDLSEAGAQPMSCSESGLTITFNGEIYNYRELREGLENKGYRFRSGSDTEVLLRLYQDQGSAMVETLRGMYAFAIWDENRQGLFLARDPFGIKPLYYADDGRHFRAASQVKALLAGGALVTTPEPAGHAGFFLWGHVPEPYTLHREIRALPAGSTMWVNRSGTKKVSRFCSLAEELAKASDPVACRPEPRELLHKLHASLLGSVRRHLVADVPVGVFLSSGLDSTSLVGLASQLAPQSLHTVTLGFEEFRGTVNDEVPLASLVARHYGAHHETVWIGRKEFHDEFPRLVEAMDQPTVDGVNSYFVCLAAARAGLKVAISGVGGDELFAGYADFTQIPKMVGSLGLLPDCPPLGRAVRALSGPLLKRFTSPKYAGVLEYGRTYQGAYLLRRGMFMPWELPELIGPEMAREGLGELQTLRRLEESICDIGTDRLKITALQMEWYMRNQLLRDTDWASMAHSLEVRVPLVDLEVLRTVTQLCGQGFFPSKKDMASSPQIPLPDAVLQRGKTGFSVPVREWMLDSGMPDRQNRGLRGWARQIYAATGFAL